MNIPSTETETFTGTTHIAVVLDKSGSMGGVRRETIDGFNLWLDAMKKSPGNMLLSITLFDTVCSTPVVEAPIGKVNPIDGSRYMPAGSTALLDAVSGTVRKMNEVPTDRYLVCVVTDGQENSSRETTKEALAALIQEKEATGRWTFTYLSAAPDAFADATAIGIQAGNTQAYTGDAVGTQRAFLSAAANTKSYATSARMTSESFFGGQRTAEAGGAGNAPLAPTGGRPNIGAVGVADLAGQTSWVDAGDATPPPPAGWITP